MFLETGQAAPALAQLGVSFLIMIGVFYFLFIRPQQTQQKKRQQMLDSLKTGDKVVTVGGIFGEIVVLKDDYVMLKVHEKVDMKVSRAGISSVLS